MMQNKKIIGLTGGISTGKSTVSKILKSKDIKVVDADEIAREVVELGEPAYLDIVDYFGEGILKESLEIDREKLGKLIFTSLKNREKLNEITHPRIMDEIRNRTNSILETEDMVILDIPLLIEGIDSWEVYGIEFDEIVLVVLDDETQINRLVDRDGISREYAIEKISSQMPLNEKRKLSTIIIDNSGTLEDLEEEIDLLLKSLL